MWRKANVVFGLLLLTTVIVVLTHVAATLDVLLRAWTFWLPMVPGMWITRHEERQGDLTPGY